MKTSKMVILTILVTIIIMAAPVSAYFSSQSIETKAERMVKIVGDARERVLDLVTLVEADETAMENITDAGLEEQFYGNVSLCVETGTEFGEWTASGDGEGWTALVEAEQALADDEYEDAIDTAREALEIFRDALKSIHIILCEADVEIGQLLDPQILQEAIDRSLDRIIDLQGILKDPEMLAKLELAEVILNEAKDSLEIDGIEDAKDSLREANALISEVCQDLKEIAQELNPQRIRDYCEGAHQYMERFRGRFGQAETEGFDVNGFLGGFGYQNEDEFMARFQEMIENAKETEDIDDLGEIGRIIREMGQNLTQEMGRHRAQHGQAGSGSGFGQEGSGSSYGGSGGSGQMGFGGSQ